MPGSVAIFAYELHPAGIPSLRVVAGRLNQPTVVAGTSHHKVPVGGTWWVMAITAINVCFRSEQRDAVLHVSSPLPAIHKLRILERMFWCGLLQQLAACGVNGQRTLSEY